MEKVSAIICAYNEEKTIKEVVLSVSKALIISEVIVVNDGSTDNTGEIINTLRNKIELTHIQLKKNKGKGHAMAVGVEQATNDIILFVDADLSDINTEHINKLINPLLRQEVDMVLGQATETIINYRINPFISLSGQRSVYKEDLMPIIDKMKTSRFGVETLINMYFMSLGKKVKYIALEGLKHPTKFNKTTSDKALIEFIKEGHQIALTVLKNYDLITGSIKKVINKNIKI